MKKLMLFMSAFTLLVSTSWADTVTYTTQGNIVSGQAASASDVTTAFTEVKTAVDANDGNITTNTAHRTGDGTDHSVVSANQSAVSALQGSVPGSTCTGNSGSDIMVRVGPLCVDKYEASVWTAKSGGTQDTTPGTTCNGDGNDCTAGYFAQSRLGVTPATGVTWFQAQQACGNANKRLLTNAEWQMAAANTPDDATCTTGSLANTGANTGCTSKWSVNDMVANVSEWVADWISGSNANATTTTGNHGNDLLAEVSAASFPSGTNYPAALVRGGDFGDGTGAGVFTLLANVSADYTHANLGFRCAR